MAQQYSETVVQKLPSACVVDITPPTFAGVASATPNTDGSISLAWLAATDLTGPIEYLLYIALGSVSAGTLFQVSNLVTIAPAVLTKKIFTLADQTTYLVNGQQYTVGVRAKDGVGNINTNVVILTPTAIASGNIPGVYQQILNDFIDVEVGLSASASAIAGGAGVNHVDAKRSHHGVDRGAIGHPAAGCGSIGMAPIPAGKRTPGSATTNRKSAGSQCSSRGGEQGQEPVFGKHES